MVVSGAGIDRHADGTHVDAVVAAADVNVGGGGRVVHRVVAVAQPSAADQRVDVERIVAVSGPNLDAGALRIDPVVAAPRVNMGVHPTDRDVVVPASRPDVGVGALDADPVVSAPARDVHAEDAEAVDAVVSIARRYVGIRRRADLDVPAVATAAGRLVDIDVQQGPGSNRLVTRTEPDIDVGAAVNPIVVVTVFGMDLYVDAGGFDVVVAVTAPGLEMGYRAVSDGDPVVSPTTVQVGFFRGGPGMQLVVSTAPIDGDLCPFAVVIEGIVPVAPVPGLLPGFVVPIPEFIPSHVSLSSPPRLVLLRQPDQRSAPFQARPASHRNFEVRFGEAFRSKAVNSPRSASSRTPLVAAPFCGHQPCDMPRNRSFSETADTLVLGSVNTLRRRVCLVVRSCGLGRRRKSRQPPCPGPLRLKAKPGTTPGRTPREACF